MSQRAPVTILIVNEHAEEIKLATVGFRGFFSGCVVEVAYSAEEARTLSTTRTREWTFILVDDSCLSGTNVSLIDDLKRGAQYAGILLQSDRSDSASAIQALQAGADFFLAKQSPAFLSELLFCAKEAVEKRELKMSVEQATVRQQQLIEALSDVFYELDAEGRFLTVGPNVRSFLGYLPEELIGFSYTKMFSEEHQTAARFRFNERRFGSRGTSRLELTFLQKPSADRAAASQSAEVSARGLYDSHRRFLGTVGVIRMQDRTASQLEQDERRVEELRAITGHLSTLSQRLQAPLATLQEEISHLSEAMRNARIEKRLEQLTVQAASAVELGNQLARILQGVPGKPGTGSVNEWLDEVLRSLGQNKEIDDGVITDFDPQLPPHRGNRLQTVEFFRHLLNFAGSYLAAVGRARRLIIRTRGVGSNEAEIEFLESEEESTSDILTSLQSEASNILALYSLSHALGGDLEISVPAAGPLHMTVRLPMTATSRSEMSTSPLSPMHPPPVTSAASTSIPVFTSTVPTHGPAQNRRAAPRVATTLPAHVRTESATWDGTVTNLGSGGVCITLPADFPSLAPQPVRVVLRTAVGILELSGSAFSRAVTDNNERKTPMSQLIIVLETPNQTDAAILTSLIDAAREQSLSFSVDVLFPREWQTPSTSTVSSTPDVFDDNHRESIRVPLTLPVRLETDEQSDHANRLLARAVNMSRDGACLLVQANAMELQGSVVIHFASGKTQPGPYEPGAPDSALPAKIIWSMPDPTAPSILHSHQSIPTARVGVRFLALTPYAERELTRLIRQHLTSPQPQPTAVDPSSLVSVHRECRNPRGQAIAVMDDHFRQPMAPDTPILIIAPGYGQTAHDYAALSHYLALHRLRVLRYDHSNHLGMSDGELQNTTLRGMQTDLMKVVEFVHHTWPTARIVVLASDLAARAALKMAVQTPPVDLLLLINPVIDVGALLMSVHGHDLVADYRYGLRRGITNLLGLNINLDQFVGDMVAGGLTDLESTLEDLRLLRSPLAIVTSPQHESSALPPSDLPHAFMTALSTQTRMVSIPSGLAGRSFSPNEPHPAAFRQILEQISSVLTWPVPPAEMGASERRSLVKQQHLELEQIRLQRNLSHISREAIGLAHLQHLSHLANLHDYRKLLDDLYVFLTPLEPGMMIVDAGIGQSDVTRALLVNHAYRTRQRGFAPEQPPLLIGLGRSGDQVYQARQNVQTLQRELGTGKSGGVIALPPLTISWMRTDWTQALPFRPQSVHRIVCNLSLSFVRSPRATLQEWYRVLHPEGRMVFTVFHPGTDLSPLYRHHLRLANQDEFSPQAQPVLHYLGRLRESIRHGILHTFDQISLTALLRGLGAASLRINPIFDSQALVVIAGKRNSSSSL